ncbi:MAG: hypothetical protein U5N86_10015 [Planctomycetota bacterium]|nr:hypothetical protein [Planctomycetota bacterium]
MRIRLLQITVFSLAFVLAGALCGSVYYCFFTDRIATADIEGISNVSIPQPPPVKGQSGLSQPDIESLGNLFSQDEPAPKADTPPEGEGEDEEVKSIDDLVVIGVIYDPDDDTECVAIVYDLVTSEQINLFDGDEYKGWKLHKVEDRVTVLLAKGETIRRVTKIDDLSEIADTAVASNQPSKPQPRAVNSQGRPVPRYASGNSAKSPDTHRNTRSSGGSSSTSSANSDQYNKTFRKSELKRLVRRKAQLMKEVYAKPFYDKGKPIGMKVISIARNSELNRFGIKPGDIILEWNGDKINSEKKCYDLLNTYENNIDSLPPQNQVVLLRNGTKQVLNINLR